jgi:hypothetical protein
LSTYADRLVAIDVFETNNGLTSLPSFGDILEATKDVMTCFRVNPITHHLLSRLPFSSSLSFSLSQIRYS